MPRQKPPAARLARDVVEFRDDRIFFIGCDDHYAPKQYFDFFRIPRIKVIPIPATDDLSHAKWVLDKLLECDVEEDDERWMVLDTDHCTDSQHFKSFEAAITEARQHDIGIAISKPCFEVWLALHHVDPTVLDSCEDATAIGEVLRKALGAYNKTKLREGDFPVSKLPVAYMRAKQRDEEALGGDKPDRITTRVYLIWRNILDKALVSQLTPPLREFAREIRMRNLP